MGLIVPLQGMLGGRYGLALGCIIPLVGFYFIQLRPRRIDLPLLKPPPGRPPKQGEPVDVQAPVSERALAVIAAKESPYGMGLKEMTENGYDLVVNPTGCIDLGTSENKVHGLLPAVDFLVCYVGFYVYIQGASLCDMTCACTCKFL